jgi:DNA-binding MarR family transcriptional regulator
MSRKQPQVGGGREQLARARRAGQFMDRNASVTFLLIAISNKLVAGASQTYTRHYGLGIMDWRVLALLAAEPGLTGKDISMLSGVTAGSVSRAINSLKRAGYLQSRSDNADNRRNFLRLTAAGLALHGTVIRSSLGRERLLLGGFSSREHRSLLAVLRRLMANVAEVNAYEPSR